MLYTNDEKLTIIRHGFRITPNGTILTSLILKTENGIEVRDNLNKKKLERLLGVVCHEHCFSCGEITNEGKCINPHCKEILSVRENVASRLLGLPLLTKEREKIIRKLGLTTLLTDPKLAEPFLSKANLTLLINHVKKLKLTPPNKTCLAFIVSRSLGEKLDTITPSHKKIPSLRWLGFFS